MNNNRTHAKFKRKRTVGVYKGHIVLCIDLKTDDHLYLEVLAPESIVEERALTAFAERTAVASGQLTSCNLLNYKYVCPSGRIIKITRTEKELAHIDSHVQAMLNKNQKG